MSSVGYVARFAAALLGSALVLGGCYFTRSPLRPVPALAFLRDANERQPCLVVFLPGVLDGPQTFVDHDFPALVSASGAACDSVAVDLHSRYYDGSAADVVYEDVIVRAVARGYANIWVVGISMGGLGAVRLAQEHPEHIDGLLLLSPFLGDPAFVATIEAAGGLAAWDPSTAAASSAAGVDMASLWGFLRHVVAHQDGRAPALLVGWAEGERLALAYRMLAAELPPNQQLVLPGRHDWKTWRRLFPRLLTSGPVGRGRSHP